MLVPKLRFKREDGTDYPEWETDELKALFPKIRNGFVGTVSDSFADKETGVRYLEGTNIHNGIISDDVEIYVTRAFHENHLNSQLKTDDIVMVQSGHIGDCAVVGEKYAGSNCHALIIMSNGGHCDSRFYSFYFHCDSGYNKMKMYMQGNTVKHILASDMQTFIVPIPDLEEQQKIADFLCTVDEVIAQSEAEVQNLEQQKKAAMQKIFSQEVRFKREDGTDYPEWEEKPMSEVFTEIIEKNRPDLPVLSILQGQGTVFRDSSDRNIMYDKKSTVNYKAMKKGDFIIHLRTFEGGLECATLDGISSPAYKILRTDKLIPEAYKAYFRSRQFIEGRLAIAVTGVRDGKNIEMSTFWEILVPVACLEEQQKIADFLSAYDEAISYAKQELDKWKELKKGLLQQMFV